MDDLRQMLDAAGVEGIRETRNEIYGRCPHPKHTDRRPSWAINRTSLLHHCFSCGYKGSLQSLLVDLTGSAPPDLEMELQRQQFLRRIKAREQPEETLEPAIPLLTDWSLRHQLVDVPQRLLELRWLVRSAIDRYQVRWNPGTRQWVLPLRNVDGELLGAQYRQVGSVLTLPPGIPKGSLVFGYHEVKAGNWAVLVESPLDAVRLFGLGIPAFATLGAWVSREQVTLMARTFSYVILALDNDKAGHQGAEIAEPMLRRAGCAVVHWSYTGLVDSEGAPAKDVGDVPDDDSLLDAFERTRRFGL
jgi:hypothetical protein